MNPVRTAVVGLGSAGSLHARALIQGRVPGALLAAVVCRTERLADAPSLPPNVRHFESLAALLSDASCCDAVIIATPHILHPAQTIAALSAGLHVFCEKPAGIRASEARQMTETANRHGKIYALNFNRRAVPIYQEIRNIVTSGQIGVLRRVHWTSTSWFRVQSYYDTNSWRGTWAGEGGGLLLNQLPHTLDLWQWICGMPSRLHAHCGFGKHHAIEVEDEVCLFAEYANGTTAVLIGATGEAPGRERIEIVGDRGTLVSEGNQLHLRYLEEGTIDEFIANAPAGFPYPKTNDTMLTLDAEGDLVTGITNNFVAAIIAADDSLLVAPGSEGEPSLMLANAILLSAWNDGRWVNLPMSAECEEEFDGLLAVRINASQSRPVTPHQSATFQLEESFGQR